MSAGSGREKLTMPSARFGINADFIFEGGSEAVVNQIRTIYPDSEVYTALYDPDEIKLYPALDQARQEGRLHTSFAQTIFHIPGLTRRFSVYHFYWLYFLTSAIQRTRRHDTVIVSSCAQSKLIRIPRGAQVVVYFHTPTRWLYPGLVSEADLAAIPKAVRPIFSMINRALRPLDRLGVRRLARHDPVWLCNSRYTAKVLEQTYGLTCDVVYPPVETTAFRWQDRRPGDFFLYHGRLTLQKRVDIAIEACLHARCKLVISGKAVTSDVQAHLERIVDAAIARDPGCEGLITFLGRTSDAQLRDLFATCRAMIFPPREDFGIAPIEAIASGVPVLAYGAGGALDYIQPGINGAFFDTQDAEAAAEAILRFEDDAFDPQTVATSLPDLSPDRFARELRAHVARVTSAQESR